MKNEQKGYIYVSRKNQHFEKNQNTRILEEEKLYKRNKFSNNFDRRRKIYDNYCLI